MKKRELLNLLDGELLESLYGFCYARTSDSHEAQDLCSDIVLALVKAAHGEGEVEAIYPYIWRVAKNVYADFSKRRRQQADFFCAGDAQAVLSACSAQEAPEEGDALLEEIYRRIAFLTKGYREAVIHYYLDGFSCAQIAAIQHTSEDAVRQRVYSARKKIRNEVEGMKQENKPVALQTINYHIWGVGNPLWGDPRTVCTRQFSRHIVWLCRKKPRSAQEIAEELNVPTLYVEEELDILAKGENGEYGLLRRTKNGKYAINFILVNTEQVEAANAIYLSQLDAIVDEIADFLEANKAKYLVFPYLNHRLDWNLIAWQQVYTLACAFSSRVEEMLREQYFLQVGEVKRPFSVYGFVNNGKSYGGGWDCVGAENVCGYAKVRLDNFSVSHVQAHFHCGLNIACDAQIQLALRAIKGLEIAALTEEEREHAAKAIECGYLYREGDKLYTQILVCEEADAAHLFDISNTILQGHFAAQAQAVAAQMAQWIEKTVDKALMSEWRLANSMANLPMIDAVVDALVERGVLIPAENELGAPGCWMSVSKSASTKKRSADAMCKRLKR